MSARQPAGRTPRLSGGEVTFLCPAHEDNDPSASWNASKAVWYCFACDASGGALDLARRLDIRSHRGYRTDRTTPRQEPHGPAGAAPAPWVDEVTGELHEAAPPATDDPLDRYAHSLIDWATFWDVDHKQQEWLVEPLLPLGRAIAMYSPAKAGKSLLTLDVAAALATGRRILDKPAGAPLNVLYFDLEMTEGDLYERLEDMNYGPGTDMSHLAYYLLPNLPPLDTAAGGAAVRALARKHEADLVIIDTTSRVISGGENDSDTLRALYQHTGLPLKADGRTVWRLDHAGKDRERGQRGTSAKNDDVDLVWELTAMEGQSVRLRATHRRQSWVDEQVDLVRLEEPLRHERALGAWPNGTKELAAQLDGLGIPVDAPVRKVRATVKEHNIKTSNDVLQSAIKYRRQALDRVPNDPRYTRSADAGYSDAVHGGTGSGTPAVHGGTPSAAGGEPSPVLTGERVPQPSSGTTPRGCMDCGVVLAGGQARCEDCARRARAAAFDDELKGDA